VREHRKLIKHKTNNLFLCYDGDTVKNNIPIAFTFTGEDFKQCRRSVNKQTTREFLPPLPGDRYPSKKRPLNERWSARHFSLQKIFEMVNETQATKINLDWYHDLSTFDGYREYLGSDYLIVTPEKGLTTPHEYVKLPYSEGEEE
jgi:hypothetical protein